MDYFEPYRQLAQRLGYDYEDSNATDYFYFFSNDPMLNKKSCLLRKGDLFFWAYDTYATKFGMNQTFSGVYRFIESGDQTFRCKISRRFCLDFILSGKRNKTGNPKIDRRVTVTSNNAELMKKLVTEKLVTDYLELPQELLPIDIIIGSDYIPARGEDKDKMVVGLETNCWLTAEQLEQYLPRLEALIREVTFPV